MSLRKIFIGIVTLISLVSTIVAMAYLLEYFFQFNEIITPIQSLIAIFEPLESFFDSLWKSTVTFKGKVYSNVYLVCMMFFLIVAFAIHYSIFYIESLFDHFDNASRIGRIKIDKGYSEKVKKNFAKTASNENSFYIAFLINLKESSYMEKMSASTIAEMRNGIYNSFASIFEKYNFVKTLIKNNRIYIIAKDFSKFDEVFIDFMRRVQNITKENIVAHIQTTAYFVIDVIQDDNFSEKDEKFIDKILKYDYKNQVIATSYFAEKYLNEVDGKFKANSIGTVRIYLNELADTRNVDFFADEAPQNNDYQDYELHVVKRKPRSMKK